MICLQHDKTPYEILHNKPPDLSYLHVFGALCNPTNDSKNLDKLQLKADIGLVPNPPPSTPFVPPSRTDWDILFQPLFDELFNPPPSVDFLALEIIAPIAEVPDGFVDKDNPNHVYKLKKALYGLKQAPRAWYDMLSSFLISQDFSKGSVDPTMFIRREGKELLLVQIYVDDIIFAASTPELCDLFAKIMLDTPMVEKSKLDEDKEGKAVDPSHYRGSAYRKALKCGKKDLSVSKRNRTSGTMVSEGFFDCSQQFADGSHAGCQDTCRSTSGSMQLLGDRLVSWSSKSRKALLPICFGFNKIPMYCDNKSAIALCCNNVQHSRSKHIDIRFHFIKEHVENGVIELYFVNTEYQLADIFTKALGRNRIEFLINKLGNGNFTRSL
ncbi:retrovirus-related pol polyprotein from transposon TNT 1-94 [Tanacetum coccineum]|uniref:Retrovirus-related pol polyprotein from transposon TNT 1-94 n=1 Tax=Tanacetum coccineum TaxID=301880 RepID=A0ABQ5IV88_9ASTR